MTSKGKCKLSLKRKANESSGAGGEDGYSNGGPGPSRRMAPNGRGQEFRTLISEETRRKLCALIFKGVETHTPIPPLPPSKLVQDVSTGNSQDHLLKTGDQLGSEYDDSSNPPALVWTPLPPPDLLRFTRKPLTPLSLEQLCGGSETSHPKPSGSLSHPQTKDVDSPGVLLPESVPTDNNNMSWSRETDGNAVLIVAHVQDSATSQALGTSEKLPTSLSSSAAYKTSISSTDSLKLPPKSEAPHRRSSSPEIVECSSDQDLFEYDNEFDDICKGVTLDMLDHNSLSDSEELPPVRFDLGPSTSFGSASTTSNSMATAAPSGQPSDGPVVSERQRHGSNSAHGSAATNDGSSSTEGVGGHSAASSSSCGSGHTSKARDTNQLPESCPMCNTEFPQSFGQVEVDEHVALCLTIDLADFTDPGIIVLD